MVCPKSSTRKIVLRIKRLGKRRRVRKRIRRRIRKTTTIGMVCMKRRRRKVTTIGMIGMKIRRIIISGKYIDLCHGGYNTIL